MVVEIAKQGQSSIVNCLSPVLGRPLEARNVLVHQLRRRCVVANDDEARRHRNLGLFPEPECLLVVPVQRLEGGLEGNRQHQRIELARLSPSLLRHVIPYVLPELPEHRHFVAGDVVRHRHPRQLDDSALDRIHEREVAHRPREECSLGVARTPEEEGRGGQVHHATHVEPARHRLQAGDPQPRSLRVLFGFLPVVALQDFLVARSRLLAVAVVGLVVEDQDALHAHERGHHPLEHLPLCLPGLRIRPGLARQQRPVPLRELRALSQPERVVVRDHDPGLVEVPEHLARDQLTFPVVGVRVVGLEHPQPVADGDPGGHDQEPAREPRAVGMPHGVDRLPGDQHGHDHRLPGSRGHLQREARKTRIRGVTDLLKAPEKAHDRLRTTPRGHLGEPDRGLGRLHLAEERADAAELVGPPVPKEPRGGRRHPPVVRVGNVAPPVHMTADGVDLCGQVLLVVGRKLLVFADPEPRLGGTGAVLLRCRERRDELRGAAPVEDPVSRLPLGVELPVSAGILVGIVQNRALEEAADRRIPRG